MAAAAKKALLISQRQQLNHIVLIRVFLDILATPVACCACKKIVPLIDQKSIVCVELCIHYASSVIVGPMVFVCSANT